MSFRGLSAAPLVTAGFLMLIIPISTAAGQTTGLKQVASVPSYNAEATTRDRNDQSLAEPAPMPDADIFAPVPHVDDPKAPHVAPSLFRPKTQFRGDGYSPGSTAQESQERSLKPAPGISLKVPLD